jgi:hypothetical protein
MKHARLVLLLAFVPSLLASEPRVENGAVTVVAASGPLKAQIESLPSSWAGYQLPAQPDRRFFCSIRDGISIEDDRDAAGPVAVFFRVEDHHVALLRIDSWQCPLDAGGLPVRWIEGVDAAASLGYLRGLVDGLDSRQPDSHVARHALTALAFQDNAIDALIDIAHHHADSHIRSSALFWLGQRAGQKAAAALLSAVDDDPNEDVRSRAVFGISNLPNDQSIPLLADLMKTNKSRQVRKKAAFWLSQKKDPRALAAIETLLRE